MLPVIAALIRRNPQLLIRGVHLYNRHAIQSGFFVNRNNASKFVTKVRRGHDDQGGVIGSNLPFTIGNKWRMTIMMVPFFASAWWLPYIVVAYHMTKEG